MIFYYNPWDKIWIHTDIKNWINLKNGGEGTTLAYRIINEFKIKKGNRPSSFGKYHSNNYRGHIPQMHANISEWTFEEKQGICIISKYLSQDIYYKTPADIALTKWSRSRLISSVIDISVSSTPWCSALKRTWHHFWDNLAKNELTSFWSWKKHLTNTKLRDILQKCQVHERQEKTGTVTDWRKLNIPGN